jgi:cytochrome b
MKDADPPLALRPVKVWDLPTRVFHWAIVLLVLASWFTNRMNWMQLHFLSGYTMLGMLVFRLLWGFLGSETARFRAFLKSPAEALRHLRHAFVREPDTEIGHNAAGGWMVLVLLALLLVQVATGLGSNDDVMVEGPLAKYVGKEMSDRLGAIHSINFTLIELAVLAHVGAVLAYWLLKRQNLLRPMITGIKRMPASVRAPLMAGPVRAAAAIASAAILAALVATRL